MTRFAMSGIGHWDITARPVAFIGDEIATGCAPVLLEQGSAVRMMDFLGVVLLFAFVVAMTAR